MNITKSNLLDKDIRSLKAQSERYVKSVGNPKELYIWVNPTGVKTFALRIDRKYTKIAEFRDGIYSIAEAMRDANKMPKELQSGKDLDVIKGKSEKYL